MQDSRGLGIKAGITLPMVLSSILPDGTIFQGVNSGNVFWNRAM